ncbi:MAG TPA: DUF1257 domain-containing protein [bacterium]|nr:DUF1257 domain-containing protein [bacterium]
MSALCGIELTIESLFLLKKTLDELKIQYSILEELEKEENQLFVMETAEGTVEKADIVISDSSGVKTGFQKQKNGQYRVISSASSGNILQQQKETVKKIKRQYAYNRVKEELAKQGYSIVEEKKIGNKGVKILARRWG